MNILLVLGLLQLLAVPALTTPRNHLATPIGVLTPRLRMAAFDYWGEFGAYGPCSRTCGIGVAKRSRKCITSRTDGGHNCVGSPNAFQTCNTQECPVGSTDFREEQCSHFDRFDLQGIYYSWVPYYAATNPCELNCLPREENFFYRHSPAVIDGTLCYGGDRTDICVDGVCRMLTHEEFMGLDENVNLLSAGSAALQPSETHAYVYDTGVFGPCSANCSGGMQHRSVECLLQDPGNPRVVDETHCISRSLQRPHSQQACNMHPCAAEYSVSSFSVCSVTCGDGVKSREVICVGPGLEHLDDHACSGLERPPTVKACRRPACHTHITWHVTDYGLCTRSCGGGVRERRVSCFDTDLNPYPETRCGLDSRPVSVEECNMQACHITQTVPSVQDPRPHEGIIRGYVPHAPEEPSASGPQTGDTYDPHPPPVNVPHCGHSLYGCCPDGLTSAAGPENAGCPHDDYDCVHTRYGCCLDEVTPAQGFGRAGCPEYQTTEVHSPPSVAPPTGDACTLPRDEGPCDTWVPRVYYDSATGKCIDFWYGSCHGNANNFASLEICLMECGHVVTEPRLPPRRAMPRRGSLLVALRARA